MEKQIYFLQWLSKESGFTENQILENMKPENHGWDDRINYSSLRDFKNKEFKKIQWLENLFLWERSILKPDFEFWDDINTQWRSINTIIKPQNIKFSSSKIKNWKIIKETKKDKETKSVKNLKI